jgi:Putative beta-lactamase-inhibitor-like, PepSY-like
MKKFFCSLFVGGLFFMTTAASAQIRSIPGVVTDSFKVKYPSAQAVTWADKITNFQARFTLDGSEYTAKYGSKGEWQGSEKKIKQEDLPAAVKDGLAKSKYATDWNVRSVITRYLPGSQTQYELAINKSELQRRTLVFSSDGRLLKD